AGFIGAPAMNFAEVTLRGEADALFAETLGMRLRVPAHLYQPLAAYRDQPAVLGIRPEHIALSDGAPGASFEAGVEVIEQLGAEIVLEARVGSIAMTVARVDPGAALRQGDRLRLSVLPGRLHFFDRSTGLAIR
ncbi:MAG TPA: TOBE domain-containing protein, partial [Usitatibacter sp.]|nr:TOBE domain-containing protein [Usitatibacter sp.]